jgi:hypothetical protein
MLSSPKASPSAARLADALCTEAGAEASCQAAQLRKAQRTKLVQLLADYRLPISGHEGYGKVSYVAIAHCLCYRWLCLSPHLNRRCSILYLLC